MFRVLAPLNLDAYKNSHRKQYSPHTEVVYSTWTPRKSRMEGVDKVVFFGLQYFIKDYLIESFNETFFKRPKSEVIAEIKECMKNYLGDEDTSHWEELHDLGYLPLKICALPEGTLTPIRVPMFTIENTLPQFYWLTNFIETILSNEIWKPMTSATIALEYRKILDKWAEKTCDNNSHVDYQGHDFSYRGMVGTSGGASSGAGHLLSFKGTDTLPAVLFIEQYYNTKNINGSVGSSIPATEHSVAETNIIELQELIDNGEIVKDNDWDSRKYAELLYLERLLNVYKTGFFSYVSDTYNLWEVIRDILPRLKDKIMNRDGRVVIRPDSGDPCDILCGYNTKTYFDDYRGIDKPYKLAEGDYAEQINKGVIELLWDIFGGTINSKGYKVLDSHIGCIYGDAITLERAEEICKRLESKGFASNNVVFGIGSYCVTKDTKILCSDLVWRKAGDIKVGQEIICFDENPIYGNGAMSSRRYKLGKIIANQDARKKCVEICCGDKKLKCSLDHPILVWDSMGKREDFFVKPSEFKLSEFDVQLPRGKGLVWRRARDISVGDKVAYMCSTWDSARNDFDIGWLSGMYDGEGTLCRWKDNLKLFSCCKISLSQNEGLVLDRVREILKKYNFTFYESITKSGCVRNTITGGFLEYLRFLGIFQPIRLMNVAKNFIKNLPVLKRNTTYSLQEVTNINNIGIQDIASITTSEGTFITDGFLTHNTFNMNTRDTFGFALKTTYGVVNGKELLLYKDPYTDDGTKKSQKGRVAVVDEEGELKYIDELYKDDVIAGNLLQPVFLDGKLLVDTNLEEIRSRLK